MLQFTPLRIVVSVLQYKDVYYETVSKKHGLPKMYYGDKK